MPYQHSGIVMWCIELSNVIQYTIVRLLYNWDDMTLKIINFLFFYTSADLITDFYSHIGPYISSSPVTVICHFTK